LKKSLRVQLSVPELALEFYVSAAACWSKPCEKTGWQIGCVFDPEMPPGVLQRLAENGRIERRLGPRYKEPLRLEARYVSSGRKATVSLENYSEGGLCFSARLPSEPGEDIQLYLEKSEDLLTTGRIQWQLKCDGGYLLGCRFIRPQGDETRDIESTARHGQITKVLPK
jgi:hypothetical protein